MIETELFEAKNAFESLITIAQKDRNRLIDKLNMLGEMIFVHLQPIC